MKELSYAKAMSELLKIKQSLQSEDSNIDELSKQISRAKELIEYCKLKLRTTEEELKQLFENPENNPD